MNCHHIHRTPSQTSHFIAIVAFIAGIAGIASSANYEL